MAKLSKRGDEKANVPIAPMIDVVFLLLIYFMVTSSLEKQEADLGFGLPAVVDQEIPLNLPDEQVVVIDTSGRPSVNGYAYDLPDSAEYSQLQQMLTRFRQSCEANRVPASLVIAPSSTTQHSAIVKVMDACSLAKIENVSFQSIRNF